MDTSDPDLVLKIEYWMVILMGVALGSFCYFCPKHLSERTSYSLILGAVVLFFVVSFLARSYL